MKKIIISIVTILALMLAMPVFADTTADQTEETVQPELVLIEGVVAEITAEGYLISTDSMGQVMALLSADTIMETTGTIVPGDYVYIDYDGKMTRSIPAQITAQVIRMHKLEGEIVVVDATDNAVILNTESHGEVYVYMPEYWSDVEITETHMTVYHSGMMSMSLPPQMSAGMAVQGYTVNGAVTQMDEGSLLIGEGMNAIQVNFEEGALPEGLVVGDGVRVMYNGMMTRSIPAQITATLIEVISR